MSHYLTNIVKFVILIYQNLYWNQIHEIYNQVCVLCFVSLMLPSYIMWMYKNYIFLFEHKWIVNPFSTTYCRLQRNFKNNKHIFDIKLEAQWVESVSLISHSVLWKINTEHSIQVEASTIFRFIWLISWRGEESYKSSNSKQNFLLWSCVPLSLCFYNFITLVLVSRNLLLIVYYIES